MVRKKQVLVIGVIFFGSIFFMISQLDTSPAGNSHNETRDVKSLQEKLEAVEKQLEINKHAMNEVRESMEAILERGNVRDAQQRKDIENLLEEAKRRESMKSFHKPRFETKHNFTRSGVCPALPYDVCQSDVSMLDVYAKLPFEDPDGGVWKQGFPIDTSDSEWVGKKLKVFVVPHSHNDPGWIKTVEKYFYDQTQHILNNIVDVLAQDSKRRFIWAEMSYLSMWWKIASLDRKVKMKALVDNGQLEMVTAGWVMTDEANAHYFAMIDQMIEGNEWLVRNLGVVPKSGWAIDPFGHSSTMTYILKKMNFENMLIQRVHYAIKKHFSLEKTLEFRWRQQWSPDEDTDIVCHMMPFYSYDVPHTCGPDPKICCQFDFARLPGSKYNCPWRVPPVAIDDRNVATRSAMLLDQYRKKSKLFKTNTLLVILGDDFRYSQMRETVAQYENYAKIMNYVNSHPEMHAEIKFGSLTEYFEAMKEEVGGESHLPSLTGDFFTYADREDHYWSGYYTSRPFHKMQDRVLESHLRGAEILFSLALPVAEASGVRSTFVTSLYPLLVEARQNLGLFQHHDGITGTAKDHVVIDYGDKLMRSVKDTKKVQMLSAQVLLTKDKASLGSLTLHFDFEEVYRAQNQPPEINVIDLHSEGDEVTVVIYNSLAYQRSGVVRFYVSKPFVAVASNNEVVRSQVNLVWKFGVTAETNVFEVQFLVKIPATGLMTYKIRYAGSNSLNRYAQVRLYNVPKDQKIYTDDNFEVYSTSTEKDLVLENDLIQATFSHTHGYLQYIADKTVKSKTKVTLEFMTYKSRNAKDKSGAYLFLPAGPADPHVSSDHRPIIRVTTGYFFSEIHVLLPNLVHRVTLYNGNEESVQPLGLHVRNDVDVRNGYDNKEIAMRLSTDIQSGAKFYTDLNGFQMQERTTYSKLPIQANFYPMASMAFLQDRYKRLSVLSGQPLGVSSLESGQLDVIMDRRLMQDDNRGVGQGVKDNVETPESFVILLEHWQKNGEQKSRKALSYPSLAAHKLSWELLHPLRSFFAKSSKHPEMESAFSPLKDRQWPCDIHLLNLRAIQSHDKVEPDKQAALLLHRVARECDLQSDQLFKSKCSKTEANHDSDFSVRLLYPVSDVTKTSLSLQKDGEKLATDANLSIKPMEIEAFKIKLS